jgi:DNA-binding HxlR family transcriptional regulator
MGSPYHQFCPVAKAMELLDERWTLLVIRELLAGSRHFNDLRRGLPRMSPTLLSKRLNQLVRAGVIERRSGGREVVYAVTRAGEELRPAIELLGAWGIRWTGELGDVDLDPQLLLWDLHRNVDLGLVPPGTTVVRFDLGGVPARQRSWWMVLRPSEVDVCDVDPGHEVAATVTGQLRDLVAIWRGDRSWSDALRTKTVQIDGSEPVRRKIPLWFRPGNFAAVPRPGHGAGLVA